MIRVIIERQLKPGRFDEYATIIRRAKKEATRKPGFMGGELYFDMDDKNKIFIIAAWDNLENWNLWDASDERKALTQELSPIMEGAEKIKILKSSRI
ncbi:antibiotic biosynthesis monooxygenase family protein [Pleionea sediminis]|uniref:antibiotic biosynthesis monooxygenase family protein n=1 Tax=Pleionea sediminis TaxID=2569479 RepID=UPI001185AC22|nr:antibiotic biosynthesis monooxygenase family protein [Pleionea sediminis]